MGEWAILPEDGPGPGMASGGACVLEATAAADELPLRPPDAVDVPVLVEGVESVVAAVPVAVVPAVVLGSAQAVPESCHHSALLARRPTLPQGHSSTLESSSYLQTW